MKRISRSWSCLVPSSAVNSTAADLKRCTQSLCGDYSTYTNGSSSHSHTWSATIRLLRQANRWQIDNGSEGDFLCQLKRMMFKITTPSRFPPKHDMNTRSAERNDRVVILSVTRMDKHYSQSLSKLQTCVTNKCTSHFSKFPNSKSSAKFSIIIIIALLLHNVMYIQ